MFLNKHQTDLQENHSHSDDDQQILDFNVENDEHNEHVSQRTEQKIADEIINFDVEEEIDEMESKQSVQNVKSHDIRSFQQRSMTKQDTLVQEQKVEFQGRQSQRQQSGISPNRQEFVQIQKEQIQDRQRKRYDSPKLSKNNSFYREEEMDYSKFSLEQGSRQQFTYQINGQLANISQSNLGDENGESQSPSPKNQSYSRILAGINDSPQRKPKKGVSFASEIMEQEFSQDEQKKPKQFSQSQKKQKAVVPSKPQLQIMKNVEIPDMISFLHTPVPLGTKLEIIIYSGYRLQCRVERDTSGLAYLYPKYHVYIDDEKQQYLMTAKRLALQKSSQYIITTDKNQTSTKSSKYIGKLRSNFMGTEFMTYDNGENPDKCSNDTQIRQQLCLVYYESNVLQTRGSFQLFYLRSAPRKMRVITPPIDEKTGLAQPCKPRDPKQGLLQLQAQSNQRNVTYYEFQNRQPVWSDKLQGFVLDFNERVNKPSVKNFQLVPVAYGGQLILDEIIVQFGRYGKKDFTLDFSYPFTPYQAFTLCVSNFDYKLACE